MATIILVECNQNNISKYTYSPIDILSFARVQNRVVKIGIYCLIYTDPIPQYINPISNSSHLVLQTYLKSMHSKLQLIKSQMIKNNKKSNQNIDEKEKKICYFCIYKNGNDMFNSNNGNENNMKVEINNIDIRFLTFEFNHANVSH